MIIFRDKFEMGIIDGTRLRENLELIKPLFAYTLVFRKKEKDNYKEKYKVEQLERFVDFINSLIDQVFKGNTEDLMERYRRLLNIYQTIVAYSKGEGKND